MSEKNNNKSNKPAVAPVAETKQLTVLEQLMAKQAEMDALKAQAKGEGESLKKERETLMARVDAIDATLKALGLGSNRGRPVGSKNKVKTDAEKAAEKAQVMAVLTPDVPTSANVASPTPTPAPANVAVAA